MRVELSYPTGLALGAGGRLYVADTLNDRVLRLDLTAGTAEVVADRDFGRLNAPHAVAVDPNGGLYVASTESDQVLRLDPETGAAVLVAGTGLRQHDGDGGPAAEASVYYPVGLALDAAGNLYVADAENHRVRKVDAGDGAISTAAGNGDSLSHGDGGRAIEAGVSYPVGLAVGPGGDLYVADQYGNCVRRVGAKTGIITTAAGNGERGFSGDGGPASEASMNMPAGVAVDSAGNVYVADTHNHRIRLVSSATGTIETLAGNGTAGFAGDGGPAIEASLNRPHALAWDADSGLYLTDSGNDRVRRIDVTGGTIRTVAGGPGDAD